MTKKMTRMIGKRLLQSVAVIIIVTMIVFFLIHLIPGDPILNFLGPNASAGQIEYYTKLYGFDQPLIIQYVRWLVGLVQGNMGFSISSPNFVHFSRYCSLYRSISRYFIFDSV